MASVPPFIAFDATTKQLPALVRQQQAANLADPSTPEGGALGASFARPLGAARTIAALGDSQTANENSAPDFTNGTTTTNASWLLVACATSNERYRYGGNYGVPGETSAQILARVGDVIATKPHMCVVTAGRNDSDPAVTISNIDKIITALVAAGITPVLGTVPPDNATSDTALQTRIRATNSRVKHYASARGIAVADFFKSLVHPQSGAYLSGLFKDTTHPNRLGLVPMAAALLDAIQPYSGGKVYRRPDNTLFGAEIVTNGLMAGGAAGVPTGWTAVVTTSGTPSLITDDPRFTNNTCWQLAAPAGTSPSYMIQETLTTVVGDVYELSFKVAIAGLTATTQIGYPSIEIIRGDSSLVRRIRLQSNFAGTLTYRFTATQTTHKVSLYYQNAGVANDSDTSVRWGELSVRDLTVLGAA